MPTASTANQTPASDDLSRWVDVRDSLRWETEQIQSKIDSFGRHKFVVRTSSFTFASAATTAVIASSSPPQIAVGVSFIIVVLAGIFHTIAAEQEMHIESLAALAVTVEVRLEKANRMIHLGATEETPIPVTPTLARTLRNFHIDKFDILLGSFWPMPRWTYDAALHMFIRLQRAERQRKRTREKPHKKPTRSASGLRGSARTNGRFAWRYAKGVAIASPALLVLTLRWIGGILVNFSPQKRESNDANYATWMEGRIPSVLRGRHGWLIFWSQLILAVITGVSPRLQLHNAATEEAHFIAKEETADTKINSDSSHAIDSQTSDGNDSLTGDDVDSKAPNASNSAVGDNADSVAGNRVDSAVFHIVDSGVGDDVDWQSGVQTAKHADAPHLQTPPFQYDFSGAMPEPKVFEFYPSNEGLPE